MDLCDDVDTHLARTIPRICATYKFNAQIHGNVRRCGAGFSEDQQTKHSTKATLYHGKCNQNTIAGQRVIFITIITSNFMSPTIP